MRFLVIFLLPILGSSFQAINNLNNKCRRASKKIVLKIKYCPYLKNQKNNIIEKYGETTKSMNKKLRYLRIINSRNMNNIYDENFLDETITSSSTNISEDLIEEIKESFSFLLDINKEYTTILSLIMTEIIKFKFNENFNSSANLKKTFQIIIFRNILIPMAIHDLFQLIFNFFKTLIKH